VKDALFVPQLPTNISEMECRKIEAGTSFSRDALEKFGKKWNIESTSATRSIECL
jgi:hypothetical protein